jgi:hypothetical protein
MKNLNKLLTSFLIILIACNLLLSGCGVFEQAKQSSALVKVRCQKQNLCDPLSVKSNLQIQYPEKIFVNSENPLPLNRIKLPVENLKIKSVRGYNPGNKQIEFINRKITNSINNHFSIRMRATTIAKQSPFSKKKVHKGEFIGLLALVVAILAIILLILSIVTGTTYAGILSFTAPNLSFLIAGLILCLISIVLAVVGLFSENGNTQILSIVTLCLWLITFLILASL